MSIVGALPISLTNGSVADANQVMTDLNFIASQVNANALPLAGGTMTGPLSGTSATFSGQLIGGGTPTNDDAAVGVIGEYIFSNVPAGSAVPLVTGTTKTVTSINLTAGDWDVHGNVVTNPAGGTSQTGLIAAISTTAATLPVAPGAGAYAAGSYPGGTSNFLALPTGVVRLSISAPTTVYLVANATFTVSTNAAYGFLGARRAR